MTATSMQPFFLSNAIIAFKSNTVIGIKGMKDKLPTPLT